MGMEDVTLPDLYAKLTKGQLDFVYNYIAQDFRNATAAYCIAFPESSEKAAKTSAAALLTSPNIRKLIGLELESMLSAAKVPLEKHLFDVTMMRAFYDPTEIIDLEGNLCITTKELRARGLQVCIDSINEKLTAKGDRYIEYKLADRDKSLDVLRQYIQMIKAPNANVKGTGPDGNPFSFTVSFVSPEPEKDPAI